MTDFSKLVRYDELNAELRGRYTDDQINDIDQTIQSTVNSGTNNGLLYEVFAFIQSLLGGLNFSNLSDSFSNITSETGKFTDLHAVDTVAANIDMALKDKGYGQVADWVSGVTDNNNMQFSAYNIHKQLFDTLGLPIGSSSSLANNNVGHQVQDEISSQSSLPNATNRSLTYRG